MRNPKSVPHLTEWKSQKCSVRASNLENYSLALAVEQAFLKCNDTDDEQVTLEEIKSKPKPLPSSGASVMNQKLRKLFVLENEIVDEEPIDHSRDQPLLVAEVISTRSDHNILLDEQSNKDVHLFPSQIPNLIENITEDLETKLNPVMEKMCRLESKLDEVLNKFSDPFKCFQDQEDMSWCNLKLPLNTVEEVEQLEKQLVSITFYKELAEYLRRKTCAKDTKNVKKVTKKVLAELFTLDLIKCFSWSGRGNKEPAFCILHRILNLILDVKRLSDSTYNEEKSANFLQNKWKCLNQTIRRTELKDKIRIFDDQVENETTVVQEIGQDKEENS